MATEPLTEQDDCDHCHKVAELFHNDAVGLALCEECDADCLPCDGCRGDGIYYGAGRVENGRFVGFTGTCFRCQGKGHQTKSDEKRNRFYDDRIRRIPT